MASGIKNLTSLQKSILYSITHYHGCVMLYNIRFEFYCLNSSGRTVQSRTANSLIKRNVLKLRGYCATWPYNHENEILITEEVKVQIALGLIEPACYVCALDHKYFDALKQIVL